ncbi:c-type cytochrome [Oceaniglobus indicus]|uniref:c-type cytochrome n=1 Tax=Oceaniglobus indicus TaxID=2047749 RepID=UPI000C186B02|nr:cytochrome c [Oceaniglobus indicus]
MKKFLPLAAAFAVTVFGAALVHAQATDDPVKARQTLMKTVGAQTKILGAQAKAGDAFDPEAARAAAMTLAEAAGQVPAAFETEALDGETEAVPAIWENYDDFTQKATALETSAMAAADASSAAEMGTAMQTIGGTCKACHEDYRQKK